MLCLYGHVVTDLPWPVLVTPINIEIGRSTKTPVNNIECPFYPGTVEDEEHILMSCPKYNTIRDGLFKHALYCHPVFLSLNITDTFIFLMSSSNITNRCGKACSDTLDIRSMLLNSSY